MVKNRRSMGLPARLMTLHWDRRSPAVFSLGRVPQTLGGHGAAVFNRRNKSAERKMTIPFHLPARLMTLHWDCRSPDIVGSGTPGSEKVKTLCLNSEF